MTPKKSLLTFAIFLILFLWYLLDVKLIEIKKYTSVNKRKLTQINFENIIGFKLKNEFVEIHCEKKGNYWYINAPSKLKADNETIKTLLTNVTAARKRSQQTVLKKDLGVFGLDSPGITFTLFGNNSPKEETLLIGVDSPVPYQVYAWSSISKEVFCIGTHIKKSLNQPLINFRERYIFHLPVAKAQKVTFIYPNSEIVIDKKMVATWKIIKPINTAADSEFIDNLLLKISTNKIKEFIDEPQAMDSYGFNNPTIQLKIEVGSEIETLIIGKFNDDKNSHFARLSTSDTLFMLPTDFVELIMINLFQARNKNLFSIKTDAIRSIDIILGKSELNLRKTDKGIWIIGDDPKTKINQAKILEFFFVLNRIKANGFETDNPTAENLVTYKLASPMMKIRISDGKDVNEVEIGDKPADRDVVFCKVPGSDTIFTMDWRFVGNLYLSKDDIVDKSIVSVDRAEVAKITIHTVDKDFIVSKNKDKWELLLMPDKQKFYFDDKSIEYLFNSIFGVEYESIANEVLNMPKMSGLAAPSLSIKLYDSNNTLLETINRGQIIENKAFVGINSDKVFIVNEKYFKVVGDALRRLIYQ